MRVSILFLVIICTILTGGVEIFAQEIKESEYIPPPDPEIEVDPMMLDFGEVPVGAERFLGFTVRNNGDEDLRFFHPVAEGDYFSPDPFDWELFIIPPNEEFRTVAIFAPQETGEFEGTMIVRSDDPDNGEIRLPLTGTGVHPGDTIISVDPEVMDFGEVVVGEVPILRLRISNIGRGILTLDTAFSTNSDHFEPFEGALAARSAVLDVIDAVTQFQEDHREDPLSIRQLINEGYLQIDEETLRLWYFTVIGVNPIVQIQATSTEEMRGGEGRMIVYDYDGNRFFGYGMIDDQDIHINAEYEIPISFIPEEIGEYVESLTIFSNDPDNPEMNVRLQGARVLEEDVTADIAASTQNKLILYTPNPNPFNSTTTIEYLLPNTSHVSLNLYNLSGRRIETLVKSRLQAGVHRTTLNARYLASGLYFVHLEASGQELTSKITVIK